MPCTISSSGCVQSSRTAPPFAPVACRSQHRWRRVCVALAYLACASSAVMPLSSCQPQRQVNIYNWADFIGSNTVAQFERQTGIKVVYDTYDSEETAETRL